MIYFNVDDMHLTACLVFYSFLLSSLIAWRWVGLQTQRRLHFSRRFEFGLACLWSGLVVFFYFYFRLVVMPLSENIPPDMSARRRLISAYAFKDAKFLHVDNEDWSACVYAQADLSLR